MKKVLTILGKKFFFSEIKTQKSKQKTNYIYNFHKLYFIILFSIKKIIFPNFHFSLEKIPFEFFVFVIFFQFLGKDFNKGIFPEIQKRTQKVFVLQPQYSFTHLLFIFNFYFPSVLSLIHKLFKHFNLSFLYLFIIYYNSFFFVNI